MATNAKRVWSQPELIVLVRSGPEEAVLSACKYSNANVVTGPDNGWLLCKRTNCFSCSVEASS